MESAKGDISTLALLASLEVRNQEPTFSPSSLEAVCPGQTLPYDANPTPHLNELGLVVVVE